MEDSKKYKVLVLLNSALDKEFEPLYKTWSTEFKLILSEDDYNQLEDKYSYTVILVFVAYKSIVEDQVTNSKTLKWVHSLTTGVDALCKSDIFRNSEIPLTNAKSAFSKSLGEFVMLGVLYHTKKLETFMN